MYTLRTLETDGREVNLYLGKHYTITKEITPDFNFKLEQLFNEYQPDEDIPQYVVEEKKKVKAFINAENLTESLPLYRDRDHYIVNESGKTFQKL